MTARTLRKLLREPIWFVLLGAAIVGAILGTALAHEQIIDPAQAVFGRAWRGDSSETRALLGGLFGFQVTIAALMLSLNAMVMKSAAYQYSPRLIPLYLKNAPIRRAVPMFVLLMAYLLAAVREVGLVADESVRPRMVISVAVGLLFVSLTILLVDLIRTFRFIRVERVLGLIRDATYAAAKRVRARVERLPLDPVANPAQPIDASALVAGEAGYLVDVDLQRLTQLAAVARVRTRIGRAIGDYVDEGEVIGWVASDDGGPADRRIAHDIVDTLVINPVRELDYDPAWFRGFGSSSTSPIVPSPRPPTTPTPPSKRSTSSVRCFATWGAFLSAIGTSSTRTVACAFRSKPRTCASSSQLPSVGPSTTVPSTPTYSRDCSRLCSK